MGIEPVHIDPVKWTIYFVFGIPFIAWLIFTKSDALRVTAVVVVLVCVQNTLVARRYLWAIGVGPSNITAYCALVGAYLHQRQIPPLGSAGIAWAALLFFGFVGLIIGGFQQPNQLPWNVAFYQEHWVEQFLYFVIGVIAFRDERELRTFILLWIGVGLLSAGTHFVTMATGFRFSTYAVRDDPTAFTLYGSFFGGNANSMGAYYCMVIPMALLLVTAGRLSAGVRAYVAVSLIAMIGSLLLAVHRGGLITNGLLAIGVLAVSLRRPGRGLAIAFVGAGAVAVSIWLLSTLMPAFADAAIETAYGKGVDTPRFEFWPRMLRLVLDHPAGVGLTPENLSYYGAHYGFAVSSTHDLYLAIATSAGIPALIAFIALVTIILRRTIRAWSVSQDRMQKQMLVCLGIAVVGLLVVGISESVWDNDYKVNNLFGLISGLAFGTATRILVSARRQRVEIGFGADLEEAGATGF